MRLTSLTLSRYGIFEAQRITFDPAPGRINLLIANNGGGKSIIRQAFCDCCSAFTASRRWVSVSATEA